MAGRCAPRASAMRSARVPTLDIVTKSGTWNMKIRGVLFCVLGFVVMALLVISVVGVIKSSFLLGLV